MLLKLNLFLVSFKIYKINDIFTLLNLIKYVLKYMFFYVKHENF